MEDARIVHRPDAIRFGRRRAAIYGVMALSLVVLLAMVGAVVDVGRAVVQVQKCQNIADMAALAGGSGLPEAATATLRAAEIVAASNDHLSEEARVTATPGTDIIVYGPNSTATGLGGQYEELGSHTSAIRVTCRTFVPYYFAKILGIEGADCSRSAVVVRAPMSGTPIAPIWMYFEDGDYEAGQEYNVYEGNSGSLNSFGLAAFASGSTSSIVKFLQGNSLTAVEQEQTFYEVGDMLPVAPGNHQAAWTQGLGDKPNNPDGRLYRASQPPYDTQQPIEGEFTWDNPRIIIIPLLATNPLDGNANTAEIIEFGAFWITTMDFNGSHNEINGVLLGEYESPQGNVDTSSSNTLTMVVKLIR